MISKRPVAIQDSPLRLLAKSWQVVRSPTELLLYQGCKRKPMPTVGDACVELTKKRRNRSTKGGVGPQGRFQYPCYPVRPNIGEIETGIGLTAPIDGGRSNDPCKKQGNCRAFLENGRIHVRYQCLSVGQQSIRHAEFSHEG